MADVNGSLNEEKPPGNPSDWFKHIVIVRSDVKREYFPTNEAYISETACIKRSVDVAIEIEKLGIKVTIETADENLTEKLIRLKPNLCINFTDSVRGSLSLAAIIPGLFDFLNIPYVGANNLSLALNSNKYLTKTLLEAWEIPTPQYQLFRNPDQELEYELRYPLILKLNEEHGGVGISERSVVTNEKELRKQLAWLFRTYKQNVLAEEFIEDSTELTGLVLESQRINIYISERQYKPTTKGFKLLTFETTYAEEYGHKNTIKHKQFVDKAGNIRRDIRLAFDILKMDDFGRFDILLDKYGNHYVVDCNANPSFGPDEAVANIARVNDHSFRELLIRVLQRNYLDQIVKKS